MREEKGTRGKNKKDRIIWTTPYCYSITGRKSGNIKSNIPAIVLLGGAGDVTRTNPTLEEMGDLELTTIFWNSAAIVPSRQKRKQTGNTKMVLVEKKQEQYTEIHKK